MSETPQTFRLMGDPIKVFDTTNGQHIQVLGVSEPEGVKFELIERDAYEALIIQRDAAKYVPGNLRCKKCNFYLVSSTLYVKSGTIGPNNKSEPCPNGCGPLWKVTHTERLNEVIESANKSFDDLNAMRTKYERLAAACNMPVESTKQLAARETTIQMALEAGC